MTFVLNLQALPARNPGQGGTDGRAASCLSVVSMLCLPAR
jgi:hypothetical protein